MSCKTQVVREFNHGRKGYQKGQPDIIITNLHKYYNGFCIEFKTPNNNGFLSDSQKELLQQYKNNGYKTMVSNDYDLVIKEIIVYMYNVKILKSETHHLKRTSLIFKSEYSIKENKMNKTNETIKTGRRCVYTKQEITAHRTAYMKKQLWFCECCKYEYGLAGKWKHLQTMKHKNKFKKIEI